MAINDAKITVGVDLIGIDIVERFRKALKLIASYHGKTLVGLGRYDEGAFHAFEQCADIAQMALDKAEAELLSALNNTSPIACVACGHILDGHDAQYGCAEDGCECVEKRWPRK